MDGDFLSIVESAYQGVLGGREAWLRGLVRSAQPLLDRGKGVGAYTYDASVRGRFQAGEMCCAGAMPTGVPDPSQQAEVLVRLDPDFIDRTYLRATCELASESALTPDLKALIGQAQAMLGIADVLIINAVDPTGVGVWLGALQPHPIKLSASNRAHWSRIAAHIASGHRLLRRLESAPSNSGDEPEAVLLPSGRIDRASGAAAEPRAREALAAAVVALDHARGGARHSAPTHALAEWKGLVAARWSLVEEFTSRGRRYLLARRNESDVAALSALTLRERQVVGFACQGHSNKLIAYELGISASTVSVLLHRAAKRLGAASRADLLAAYKASLEPNGAR